MSSDNSTTSIKNQIPDEVELTTGGEFSFLRRERERERLDALLAEQVSDKLFAFIQKAFPILEKRDRIHRLIARLTALLGSIAVADRWPQVLTAMIQFAVAECDSDTYQKFCELLHERSESMEDAVQALRYLKMLSATAQSSPMILQLGRCMSIATVLGLVPKAGSDTSWVPSFLASFAEKYKDVQVINIPEMVIESMIFACKSVQAFQNGTFISTMLNPDALAQRYARLDGLFDSVLNRTNEMTMEDWTFAMQGCLNDIASRCASFADNAPGRLAYTRMQSEGWKKVEAMRGVLKTEPFQEQPLVFVISSGTRGGKSKYAFDLIKRIGTIHNFPHAQENIAIFQTEDKYDTVINGETTVVIYDEVAAIQQDKSPDSVPFGQTLLNNVNNISQFAVKADINDKGRIKKKFKMIVILTNVPSLGLHTHMNCPAAGFARINMCVRLDVKDEFCVNPAEGDRRLDQQKVAQKSETGFATGDWYNVTCYNYEIKDKKVESENFEAPYKAQAKPVLRLKSSNIKETFAFLIDVAKNHYSKQNSYIVGVKEMMSAEFCGECMCYKKDGLCDCVKPELGTVEIFDYLTQVAAPFGCDILGFLCRVGLATPNIDVVGERVFFWFVRGLIPWVDIYTVLSAVALLHSYAALCAFYNDVWTFLFIEVFLGWSALIVLIYFKRRISGYVYRRAMRSGGCFDWNITAALSAAGLALSTLMAIRNIINRFVPQSGVYPDSDEEIDSFANKQSDWAYPVVTSDFPQTNVRTMSESAFLNRVSSNQVRITLPNRAFTNALMLDSDTIVFNRHAVPPDLAEFQTTFLRGAAVGQVFLASIHSIARDEESDVIVARVSNGPNFRDIWDIIAERPPSGKGIGVVFSRKDDGTIAERKVNLEHSFMRNPSVSNLVQGTTYKVPEPTYPGMCGSAVVDLKTLERRVVGIHSSGNGSTGNSVALVRPKLREMVIRKPAYEVKDLDAPFEPETAKPLRDVSKEVHFRCATRFVTKDVPTAALTVYGTIGDRRKRYNTMKFSSIHDMLTEMGWPTVHGLPVFSSDRQFAEVFQRAVLHQMKPIPQHILAFAQSDYLGSLAEIGRRYSPRLSRPLTYYETLNGIGEIKYVDSVNKSKNTAAGLGFGGKKQDWYQITETVDGNVIEMVPELQSVVENIDEKIRHGIPMTLIVKADLKEEPRPLEKVKKLRVFGVTNVADNIIVKKYFCPIASYMYLCPAYSEQFQGLNVGDRDAHDMTMRILEYGNQLVEGDYKKYDTMLSKQMILAAGGIFASVARWIGYNEDDVLAVETIMSSIANAYWNFNGTLVQFNGYNPSGIWITILIAGTCNCLLKRIAYKSLYDSRGLQIPGRFRDYVVTMTVGDDSLDGVHPDNLLYSFSNLRDEFAKYNITLTGSDKDGITPDFIDIENATFCKRSFRYDQSIQKYVMCLDLNSISRSLHIMHRSVETEQSVMLGNCTNALLELARHPREVYDKYSLVVFQALRFLGIQDYCPVYEYSYDCIWRERLIEKYLSPEEILSLNGPSPDQIMEATEEERSV